MGKLPGISREEEEQRLREVIAIAEDKLSGAKQDVRSLEAELHAMQQEFDESDKEQQALWHSTDARFQEVRRELQRVALARKKPYFGRIDFLDPSQGKEESYYIGRSVIAKDPAHPEVIDWRAPISSVYYDSSLGKTSYSVKGEGKFEIDLKRKRTYEIEDDRLKDFYDSDVVANDELLTKYLAKNKRAVLGEIIATIQQEQNEVIRRKPQHNMIVQGAAGSGKTTVAMHRISYILYNYDLEFKPEDFYVVGSNQVLLNYITGVLPELNVNGVVQMTMEQLFVRLLYEDWDRKKYSLKPVIKGVTEPVKGTLGWFQDLQTFCREYERSLIPREDVFIEKNHVRLLSGDTIERLLDQFERLSRADKITMLTERLEAKLENEISGKYYSYTSEEKKQLKRYYGTYFGRREWKGSLYDLYDAFLKRQAENGKEVRRPEGCFDVYDLAALAYLYKRIKETEIIREAGHVVIDEAQDFGMMVYASLKYCLSTCTYTIMGDVSQNIFLDYGLNDWQELRELMLPGEFDTFGLLRKSYRNTVEISEYATEILHHGTFQVYPVQPIVRHGSPVLTRECAGEEELLETTAETIRGWQKKGLETIAVICKDQEQSDHVGGALTEKKITLLPNKGEKTEFGTGVLVLPLEYTKGLEFDAVLIYDASQENYPPEDGQVKRLYVAATRALHELTVLYQGQLTDLIAKPVGEEEKKKHAVLETQKPARKPLPPREERTHAEIARERAERGEKEMAERNDIGPRRIVVNQKNQGGPDPGNSAAGTEERERYTTFKTGKYEVKKAGPQSGVQSSYKLPSYYERQLEESAKPKERELERRNTRKSREFGSMPEQSELRIPGHSRIDCAVKLCMQGKNCVDIVSSYGKLRIEILEKDLARVCFQKGGGTGWKPIEGQFAGKTAPFRYKDVRDHVEISTEKMQIRVEKRSGAVQFCSAKGTVLLSEREKEPRQTEEKESRCFFDWEKKEELLARTPDNKPPVPLKQSALYISYGEESQEMPALHSNRGYELILPAGRKTMCCNIAMYGTYIAQEGPGIEYYFRIVT